MSKDDSQKSDKSLEIRLPCQWNITMLFILIIGIVIFVCKPSFLRFFDQVPTDIHSGGWSLIIGILLMSIPISHYVTNCSIRGITRLLDLQKEETVEDLWAPALVGLVESILYPIALLINQAEFIGLWLAIKVAGQWVGWSGEKKNNNKTDPVEFQKGRRRFNRFLVGNALRVILAFITYGLILVSAVY